MADDDDAEAATSRHSGIGCMTCGSAQARHRCSRCLSTWYCCPEHQREDWAAGHKQECRALADARAKIFTNSGDQKMSAERCRALVLEAKQLLTGADGPGAEAELGLDLATRAVAMSMRVAGWPPHRELGGARAPGRGVSAEVLGLQAVLLYTLESHSAQFCRAHASKDPERCRRVIARNLRRAQLYLAKHPDAHGSGWQGPGHSEMRAAQLLGELDLFYSPEDGGSRPEEGYAQLCKALEAFRRIKEELGGFWRPEESAFFDPRSGRAEHGLLRHAMIAAFRTGRRAEADKLFAEALDAAPDPEQQRLLQLDRLKTAMGEIGRIRDEGQAMLANRPELKAVRCEADIPPGVLQEMVRANDECRHFMDLCHAEFPVVRASALASGDFHAWSQSCVLEAFFQVRNGQKGDHGKARRLAAEVLRIHTCSGACHDSKLARQVIAGRGFDLGVLVGRDVPIACQALPRADAWRELCAAQAAREPASAASTTIAP